MERKIGGEIQTIDLMGGRPARSWRKNGLVDEVNARVSGVDTYYR